MKRWLLVAVLAAEASGCGSDPQPPRALGMNDVSILMPLPTDATVPVLMGLFDPPVPLADPIWFDAMVFTRGDLGSKEHDYFNDHSFHVVAVRVDLCDQSDLDIADGTVSVVDTGTAELVKIHGLAYDAVKHRLFAVDHQSSTDPDTLHIFPLAQ